MSLVIRGKKEIIWCRCNGESAHGLDKIFEIGNLEMDAVFMIKVNTICLSQLRDKTGLNF